MGHKTRGGYWCDFCGGPVAGEKATHRMRGTAGVLAAGLTGGASLIAAVPGSYHCPNCGNRVRPATNGDYAALEAAVHQHLVAEVAAELPQQEPPRPAQEHLPPAQDWKSLPSAEIPPWRVRDRARLDTANRKRVEQQLKEVEDHRAAGRLSSAEYEVVRQRLIESGPIEKQVEDANQLGIFGGVGRSEPGLAEQLKELASLHASGALTDDEFSAAKSRLIHG